jgi:dTDP-4-amino-4,6-dideoxygalactose transaminase
LTVGLADLVAQYRTIQAEVDASIHEVLESGRFILGPVVAHLEAEIAAFCGARYGVAVNSGTDALLLALLAHGIGPGDEVITTPFTFVATVEAILHAGATPVFADIDECTFNMSAESAAARVTPRTRALMPVDLFGQMADRPALLDLADRSGLTVIWDGAQAIGARYNGLPLGGYPHSATLSFFPTKNLGAYGDGGLVLTNDEAVRDRVVKYRFHGSGGGYHYAEVGYCSRLDALQAAILRVKLRHLPAWTDARRQHAALYVQALAGSRASLPVEMPGAFHTYHQFTIRHPQRDKLKAFLAARGIDSGVYYDLPLHLQHAYASLGHSRGDFPVSERVADQVLSLPVHPELTAEQVRYVAAAVGEFDAGSDTVAAAPSARISAVS